MSAFSWPGSGASPGEDDAPMYLISVVAELTGLHPQTLRQYDRVGLVSPGRATGRGRRYSALDLARLRRVVELTSEGVNLAGVRRILSLEAELATLRGQLTARAAERGGDDEPWTPETANLPVPFPTPGTTAVVLWRRTPRAG
jgi:MerR family transcriptional regulator/heat shock protein HspR